MIKRYEWDADGFVWDDRRLLPVPPIPDGTLLVLASDYDALAAELAAAEKQWNVDVAARGKLLNRVAELEAALREIRNYADLRQEYATDASTHIYMIAVSALTPAETEVSK